MSFDLDTIEQADVEELQLVHPVTGMPVGEKILVYSYDSDYMKDYVRRLGNSTIKKNSRNGVFKPSTVEEQELTQRKIIAKAVKSWGGMKASGKELDKDPEIVMQLLKSKLWISEQIDTFARDRSNYFRGADPSAL